MTKPTEFTRTAFPFAAAMFPEAIRLAEEWGAFQIVAPEQVIDDVQRIMTGSLVNSADLLRMLLPIYRNETCFPEYARWIYETLPVKSDKLLPSFISRDWIDVDAVTEALRINAEAIAKAGNPSHRP